MFPRLPDDAFSFEGTLDPWTFVKRMGLALGLGLAPAALVGLLLPWLSSLLDGYVSEQALSFLLAIVYLPLLLAFVGAGVVIGMAAHVRVHRWFRSRFFARR